MPIKKIIITEDFPPFSNLTPFRNATSEEVDKLIFSTTKIKFRNSYEIETFIFLNFRLNRLNIPPRYTMSNLVRISLFMNPIYWDILENDISDVDI